jgi:hypothetical protein
MKTKQIDLGRLFNLENLIQDTQLRLLSAAGGSNDHDADYSEKLKLLRQYIASGKVCRKADGTPYGDNELLAMPFDKFKQLYDGTPATDAPGTRGDNAEQPDVKKAPGWQPQSVDLARVFTDDRALTLLSAKLDCSTFTGDAARADILYKIVKIGRMPMKEPGKYFTADELLQAPVDTLRLLLANLR